MVTVQEMVVLGVRPDAHAFGYAFVAHRAGTSTRLIDAGVIRARGAYGGSRDPAASLVRQGRELAGLLRVVANRERVGVIAAPAFVVDTGRATNVTRISELSRGWGQLDLLGEAMGVQIVVVPPTDITSALPTLRGRHGKGAWLAELSGDRLKALAEHAWVAIGAAEVACSSGRVTKVQELRSA